MEFVQKNEQGFIPAELQITRLQALTPDIPAQMVENTAERNQAHERVFKIGHKELPLHPNMKL